MGIGEAFKAFYYICLATVCGLSLSVMWHFIKAYAQQLEILLASKFKWFARRCIGGVVLCLFAPYVAISALIIREILKHHGAPIP